MLKLSSGNTRTLKRFLAVILTISLLLGTFTTTTLATSEDGGEENDGSGYVETFDGGDGDDTADSGDNPADNGDDTADNGDDNTDNGDDPADNGSNPADDGDDTTDNGENTADNGEENQSPAQDEQQTAYMVTNSVANASLSPVKAYEGKAYTGVITPNDGYLLPADVTVKIGEGAAVKVEAYDPDDDTQSIPDGFTYTRDYDSNTSEIQIDAELVTGDITISGTANEMPVQAPMAANVTLGNSGADYTTLTEAFNAVDNNGTITLLSDIVSGDEYGAISMPSVNDSKNITITSDGAESYTITKNFVFTDTDGKTTPIQGVTDQFIGFRDGNVTLNNVTLAEADNIPDPEGDLAYGILITRTDAVMTLGEKAIITGFDAGAIILFDESAGGFGSPTLNITDDAKIIDNDTYGIRFHDPNATVNISGSPKIVGNTSDGTALRNVFFDNGGKLTITGPLVLNSSAATNAGLGSGAEIGVRLAEANYPTGSAEIVIATGAGVGGLDTDAEARRVFFSDKEGYYIKLGTGANVGTVVLVAGKVVDIELGANMTLGSGGALVQGGLDDNDPIADIIINANTGYEMPASVTIGNNLTYERISNTQAKISGIPLGNVDFTLPKALPNVVINLGTNMSLDSSSGANPQNGVTGAITDIKINADENYELPETVSTVNGIAYVRNTPTTATISGTPSAAVNMTIPNATPAAVTYNVAITNPAGSNISLDNSVADNGALIQNGVSGAIKAINLVAATGYIMPADWTATEFVGKGLTYTRDPDDATKATISGEPDENITATLPSAIATRTVTITLGQNMTLDAASGNGALTQTVEQGTAITAIEINAASGCTMPATWTAGLNGLIYTRDAGDPAKATISGIPSANVTVTVPNATRTAVYVHKDKVDSAGGVADGSFEKPYKTIQDAFNSLTVTSQYLGINHNNLTPQEIRVLSDLDAAEQIVLGLTTNDDGDNKAIKVTICSYTDATNLRTIDPWTITATGTDYGTGNTGGLLRIRGHYATSKYAEPLITLKNITLNANDITRVVTVHSTGSPNSSYAYLYLESGATLKGGHSDTNGGGVNLNAARLTMNGGTIQDNTAQTNGGGVFMGASSSFVMRGGMIKDNTAKTNGGGVFRTAQNDFFIGGGSDGDVITITGNENGAGHENNVYTAPVMFETLKPGSKIGIWKNNATDSNKNNRVAVSGGKITPTGSDYNVTEQDMDSFFLSDYPEYAGLSWEDKKIYYDMSKRSPFSKDNLKAGISKTGGSGYSAGDGWITVFPSDSTKWYAVVEPDGTVVKLQGNDDELPFYGLMPGQKYTVYQLDNETDTPSTGGIEITIPAVDTGAGGNATAAIGAGGGNGSVSITIDPSSDKVKYAVTDASGSVITTAGGTNGWQEGDNGPITFTGLNPNTEYRIVTVPIGTTTPDSSGFSSAGTPVKTAENGIDTKNIKRTGTGDGPTDDTITLSNTNTNQEYALVDKDGNILADWKSASGTEPVAFSDLDATKPYWVITRQKDNGIPTAPVLVPPRSKTDGLGTDNGTVIAEVTAPDAVSIKIKPTDTGTQYAVVKKDDGTVVSPGWTTGVGDDAWLTFGGLDPDEDYIIVTRPTTDTTTTPQEAAVGSGLDIHTPDAGIKVPGDAGAATAVRDESTTAGKDKATLSNTTSGQDYILVPLGANDKPDWSGLTTADWKAGTGNATDLVFDPIDQTSKYQIFTRDHNAPDPNSLPVAGNIIAPILRAKGSVDVSTGHGKITVNPTDANLKYVILGPSPSTSVADKKESGITTGGSIEFKNLMPGQEYTVLAVKTSTFIPAVGEEGSGITAEMSKVVRIPAVDPEVGGNATASADGTNATITINPASDKVQYALIDPDNGNLLKTWQPNVSGKVEFTGLAPTKKYEVVTWPTASIASAPATIGADTGLKEKGTAVTTPKADLKAIAPADVSSTQDSGNPGKNKIVVANAGTGQEYGLYDPVTGTTTWVSESGGKATFPNVTPGKVYEVTTRTPQSATTTGQPSLHTKPLQISASVPANNITGGVNDASSPLTAFIIINPSESNLDYALLNADGTEAATWKQGNGGEVKFDGLDPEKEYKIVTRPKNGAPTSPTDVVGGTAVVTPPAAVNPVTRTEVTPATSPETDKITFPTETGKEYAVVEKGSTTPITGTGTDSGAWAEGTGTSAPTDGIRTVTGLNPNKEYEVLVRVKVPTPDDGKIYLTNSTTVPKLPDDFKATAKWNSANNTSVTITPTDPNYKYALVGTTGTLGGDGWRNSPNANGTITWNNLPEGTAYTVVYYPKDQTSPTGAALTSLTGKKIVTPIKPVDANSIKTTTTTLTINPTNPNQSYALVDPVTGDIVTVSSGTTAGWLDGDAASGAITFDNLTPGKVYEVITVPKTLPAGFTKDDVLARPGTNAVTKFNTVTGTLESNGTATVTVDPTQTDTKYAIVDKNGTIVGGAGGWKDGTGGALSFTGLTPGELYKVISVPKNSPDSGYPTGNQSTTAGTAVITPKNPNPAIDATSTSTTITVRNATGTTATDPTMEYALVGPDGNIVGGEWKNSPNGGAITFAGLTPGTEYKVVARPVLVSPPNDTYANAERPYVQPGFPIATSFSNITGAYTNDSNTSVKVGTTSDTMKYAVVDGSGNVVGGWQTGGSDLTFSNLTAGTNYKIVSVPDGTAAPGSSALQAKAGVKIISPVKPAESVKVTTDQTSITVQDTDPTIEYAIYDPVSGKIVAGGWKTGNSTDLVFSPVAAGKEYKVVTRKKNTDPSVTSVYALPGTDATTAAATTLYTVTFNMNGSSDAEPTQVSLPINATFELPAAPTKSGAVFAGWSDGKKIYPAESIYTMPASNVTFKAIWKDLYGIGGIVRAYDPVPTSGAPVTGAEVSLWRGKEQFDVTKTTLADGIFAFTDVPSGMYNIIVESNGIKVTKFVYIDANKPNFDIYLPEGKKNSAVEVVGENTPPIMVGNLDNQFTGSIYTPADMAIITGDGIIALEFIAEQLDEEIVPESDKTKISSQTPSGMEIGMYLDFSLWKKVTEYDQALQALSNETTVSNVPQTPSLLEIYIPLPAELQGMAVYSVSRIHNGVPERLGNSNGSTEGIRLEKEDGVVVGITVFAYKFSVYALAYSETAPPTPPTPVNPGSGGSSGGSGGGGGGGSAIVSTHWIEVPEAKTLVKDAQSKGLDYARSSRSGITGIRKNSLLEINKAGLSYRHDTLEGSAVQVRVYIDEPGKATKDVLVSGYVKGTAVDTVKAKFEKFYPGKKLAVVSFDQQGDFGMTVRVAAKVNLSGMDANNLYFYAYDKKTNKYVNFRPEYRIDASGYLHFATDHAGDIIISDGPLKGTDGGAIPQNPNMGGDSLDNPTTGGDGPGYLVQNAVQTQTTEQLVTTQEAVEALPDAQLADAQLAAQTVPDESAGQIKLQIPSVSVDTAIQPTLDEKASLTLTIAIAAIFLAAGFSFWFIMAKRRRKD